VRFSSFPSRANPELTGLMVSPPPQLASLVSSVRSLRRSSTTLSRLHSFPLPFPFVFSFPPFLPPFPPSHTHFISLPFSHSPLTTSTGRLDHRRHHRLHQVSRIRRRRHRHHLQRSSRVPRFEPQHRDEEGVRLPRPLLPPWTGVRFLLDFFRRRKLMKQDEQEQHCQSHGLRLSS
jgi:hypothetical protein